jgi:hypothetical protein
VFDPRDDGPWWRLPPRESGARDQGGLEERLRRTHSYPWRNDVSSGYRSRRRWTPTYVPQLVLSMVRENPSLFGTLRV